MKPILAVNLTMYACGDKTLFVSRVTEKVIVVVCNDICEMYYRRSDGYPKGRERSGLASIGIPMTTNLSRLEEFLKENGTLKNGTYVYDSGFRIARDSKDRVVRPEVTEAFREACKESKSPTYTMLKKLGYAILDCRVK